MSGKHSRISWKRRMSYQDLFTDLLYTTKLEERSLDVDGYVKSIEAIWKRLDDINLELPEGLVVLMTLMGLPPSFGTQRRALLKVCDSGA